MKSIWSSLASSPSSPAFAHRHHRDSIKPSVRHDKFETSPNNLARCRMCRNRILKGQNRFGIKTWFEKFHKYGDRYYHEACLPEQLKAKLNLQGGNPEDEKARVYKEKIKSQNLILERYELREDLRRLRSLFARRLQTEHYRIFYDVTLDDLVLKLPQNKQQLLNIYGIKEKKYQSFGKPILQVIHQYLKKTLNDDHQHQPNRNLGPAFEAAAGSGARATIAAEDDDIISVQTMTFEEIVQQKFDHAEANGYVMSVDI